jgi:class 3 adenylate cyclase/tetratricopeptide (TPR) repeat protein
MAQTPDRSSAASSPLPSAMLLDERMRRYLPPDLADKIAVELDDQDALAGLLPEALAHLAASRHRVATYLPRLLVHQLLGDRLENPWLRWVEGSLLFADLSGSTALAERLGALGREGIEMVAAFLNDIFETMIRVVRDYGGDPVAFGGDLVAFGGDALLIFFGDDRHPRTAARAALALQEALHGYVRAVPGVGEFPMHLHAGIESGRLAFVSAGHPPALHYSVLGGTVNGVVAAESRAGPGEVVVGPQAWAVLGSYAQGAELADGFVRLSAVRAPVRPYEPPPEEPAMAATPEVAIPILLDDLDRISPYIPPLLLGRILADPERPQVEADLRPVTVLFAQVAGLELPAEMLAPALAAQAVQSYVGAMQDAIELFGGVVNKLDVADEGIKLVAIFGAPAAYEDHTERGARAALDMCQRLEGVNQQIASFFQPEDGGWRMEDGGSSAILHPRSSILKQRIGLNLGTVFAGNVGSALRKEYTVMGDAVNVAARVMSKAAWGEVWCSAAAAQAIGARMRCEERGQIALKGKSMPLLLFRLIGEGDAAAGAAAYGGPLVGRAHELSWLREQMRAALGGAGRAVRIVGEAGVGKTRLTAALLEEAVATGARLIAAACFSYTAGIPYAAWAEWLKALCGIAAGDSDAVRECKLADQLADLGQGMEEWLPILGDLARLDVPENRLTRGLDPQMRQARRFELLEQLLLHAAESGPVVALFEDLHWADPVSLDLWRRVTGALAGRPVLLLGVQRPAAALDGQEDGAQVLALKELSDAESGDLLAELAGDAVLPAQLVEQLVRRAAGNPLFLAELLHAVQQRLEIRDERLESHNLQSPIANLIQDLPDSLSGLLLARIDRLDESSRGVLRVGSVIGQRMPFGVLQSIQSADQQVLLRQLARLDAEEMTVLERSWPEPIHAFRHALIQEVTYQSMLYARRRELHGRIGEYLERRHADDLDDYYGLLAHHYRLSDRRDKAIDYLLKAGHAARDIYANEEAVQYYCWALDALGGDEADPRSWQARDALGDVYATVGRYEDALAQHAAVLAVPGLAADAAQRAHRKRGGVLEKQGQYDAALAELDQALAIVRADAAGIAPLAIPLIYAEVALVRQRRGEYDLALAACEDGLRALRPDPRTRDDELIEARLHSTLGTIYGMRGEYQQARHYFDRSLQVREQIDDLPGMIISHNNLGYLWQLQSEYERAIGHYRIAEELARKINLRYTLVFAALNTASALISLGAYIDAEARCDEALVLSQEISDRHTIAQIHNTLGVIFYHEGEYERALTAYDEASRLHRSLGSVHQEGSTLANLGIALNAQGRFAEASLVARQALEHAEALQAQRLKAETLNALAEAAFGLGDIEGAAAYAGEAAILSQEIGSKHDEGIARRLLGQAAAARGELFAAEFEASIVLFEAIKDRFELARTWTAYGIALTEHGDKIVAQAYLKQAQHTFVTIGANGELRRLAHIAERSV